MRGRHKLPLKLRAFSRPCATCHINPRYSRAVSYCRACVRARCYARWKKIAADPAKLAELKAREAGRNLTAVKDPLACNQCGVVSPDVRTLIAHKREHSGVVPLAEQISLLPSTASWF